MWPFFFKHALKCSSLFSSPLSGYESPRVTQERLRKRLLQKTLQTEYGRSLNIQGNEDIEEWQNEIPVVTYSDLHPWIEKQRKGEENQITAGRTLFYEQTSGSSGPAKYIPYSPELLRSFTQMFRLWASNVLEYGPPLRRGKMFFSVSWSFQDAEDTGTEDDSDYLSGWVKWAMKPFFCLPPYLKKIQDPFDYKCALAAFLLAEEKLEIISIWNPSYFLVLFEFMQQNQEKICKFLWQKKLEAQGEIFPLPSLSQKRKELLSSGPLEASLLWPSLKILSCWTSANAAYFVPALQKFFPQVWIQGKGLLSTEAPLTIPFLRGRNDPGCFLPLLHEVYFEFQKEGETEYLTLDQLQQDGLYEVIISQKSGLLRYRLGDQVRVSDSFKETPCLEFIGRKQQVSDLVGEKLSEAFVQECWQKTQQKITSDLAPFVLLLPQLNNPPFYLLLVEKEGQKETEERYKEEFEKALMKAFHYRNASQFGQLAPLQIRFIPHLQSLYLQYQQEKGKKWGNVKPSLLWYNTQEAKDFALRYISKEA